MTTSEPATFKSAELGLSIQKKVFGRIGSSRTVVKHLIDDTSGKLLDNVHRLVKVYIAESKSKGVPTSKDAEKVVKHLIKIIIKIGLLTLNESFTAAEHQAGDLLQRKLRSTLMTVVSFHEVDFSYDREYLQSSFNSIRDQLKSLIRGHLSEKSAHRVDVVFDFFTEEHFLDRFFEAQRSSPNSLNDPIYRVRCELMADTNVLLERGRL